LLEGSGVNTYKMVNLRSRASCQVLLDSQAGKILTQATEEIQAKNFNHATQDLYEAIEKGDYPEWEFCANHV